MNINNENVLCVCRIANNFLQKVVFFQFSLALYVEKFISCHKYYKYIFLSNFISVQIIYFLNF